MTDAEIKRWLNALARDLQVLRHEVHDAEFWDEIRKRLLRAGYRHSRAASAAEWIIRGERRYKRTTTYQDFYPTREMLESLELTLIPVSSLHRLLAEQRERLRREYDDEILRREQQDPAFSERRRDTVEAARMQLQALDALNAMSDLRAELAARQHDITRLQAQIESLKAELRLLRQQRGWKHQSEASLEALRQEELAAGGAL
ncbi:MAG: hypothetical protein HYX66_08835 [Ignavibacteria bacterium]|nr:hypothetical protein [Ignavibacteria bacterium]